jgi:hypothetical protein
MPFKCGKCGGTKVKLVKVPHPVNEGSSQRDFEIYCVGCWEPRRRTFTTAPVVYDDLLVDLSEAEATGLSHQILAFLVARPEAQVRGALMRMRGAQLVLWIDEKEEGGETSDSTWTPAEALDALRAKAARKDSFGNLYFDLSQDIGAS